MAEFPAGLADLLHDWLDSQRWFPAKGLEYSLTSVGSVELPGTGQELIEHHLVGVVTSGQVQVVQLPLVLRRVARSDDRGLIGMLGARWVYDAPHDPAYVAALLQLIDTGASAQGAVTATGRQRPGWRHDPTAPARVLTGEQSNTSIIVEVPDQPLMVKLFRVITNGPNPDVEVTSALSAAGVDAVARVAGWVDGAWTSPDGQAHAGHLAVSAEFLPGSQDAWREAVQAVASNADFTTQATQLGAATARVHLALAEQLGSAPATQGQVDALVTQLRGRIDWALREVPQLRACEQQLAAHAESLADLTGDEVGALQRVHGDFHLGQVLHSPDRGWILLDFEGEPLRPLAERIRPDVPARDVVGMLRSFDYAAGFVNVEEPDLAYQTATWAKACGAAFLRGYHDVRPDPTSMPGNRLYEAMLLDKALYEVVYEARNRPDWIAIPMTAVNRVLDR